MFELSFLHEGLPDSAVAGAPPNSRRIPGIKTSYRPVETFEYSDLNTNEHTFFINESAKESTCLHISGSGCHAYNQSVTGTG